MRSLYAAPVRTARSLTNAQPVGGWASGSWAVRMRAASRGRRAARSTPSAPVSWRPNPARTTHPCPKRGRRRSPLRRSLLAPARRTRRTFEQTVQLLELFLYREGRAPAAREEITVDGESVRIGPWLAKTLTKHRAGQLYTDRERLIAALFDGDWTDENVVRAAAP